MTNISKLHFITANASTAELACRGGVDWVQLRMKGVSYDEYFAMGREVQAICKRYNATFIVNDSIELALALGADGVHVGKDDPLPQHHIDEMLTRGGIIGCTANAIEDFIHLSGKAVSYIGLGPFRFTTTKQKLSPILGIDGYSRLFAAIGELGLAIPPVVGIGGITESDVAGLMATGLHGIAVSGAIGNSADIANAARNLKMLIDKPAITFTQTTN